MKFKVGDKVRVRTDLVIGKKYGGQGCKERLTFLDAMRLRAGHILTVAEHTTHGNYAMEETAYYFSADMLEPASKDHRKIVITQDGVVIKARLYNGDTVIKETSAKCHPDDEFNFEIGASLAFECLGLQSDITTERSQYYSGKVVCVKSAQYTDVFTKGRIYTIIDGKLFDNGGALYDDIISVDHLNEQLCSKFIALVE